MKDIVIKNNKPSVKKSIDSAIAICNVIEKYGEFNSSILNYITKYEMDLEKLQKLADGKSVGFSKVLKQFYLRNKNVIDTINKYIPISEYIDLNYTNKYLRQERIENTFALYMYLYQNEEEMETILKNLDKLKSLNVKDFYFDEEYSFEGETTELNTIASLNDITPFYDNMEILPHLKHTMVKYKSNDSKYRLDIANGQDAAVVIKDVIINSLTFDTDTLPNELTREETVNKILTTKKVSDSFKDLMSLNSSIPSLEEHLNKIEQSMGHISRSDVKIELLVIVKHMLEETKRMKDVYNRYIDDAIDKDVTQEMLEVANIKKLELH